MENSFSEEKLDEFLRKCIDENRGINEKGNKVKGFPTHITSFVGTSTCINLKGVICSKEVIFGTSYLFRIVLTLLGVFFIAAGIKTVLAKDNVGILFITIGFVVPLIYWLLKRNHELKITYEGLVYDNVEYKWHDIEKTMIREDVTGGSRKYHHYFLLVAMKNGDFHILDLNELIIKSEEKYDVRHESVVPDHAVIAHFVEYFKQKRSEMETD